MEKTKGTSHLFLGKDSVYPSKTKKKPYRDITKFKPRQIFLRNYFKMKEFIAMYASIALSVQVVLHSYF